MSLNIQLLSKMGWEPFFHQQLNAEEWQQTIPCRVTAVHRGQLLLTSTDKEIVLPLTGKVLTDDTLLQSTIGDWLLLDKQSEKFVRQLERKSLFKRKAAGTANRHQLVAANINTLFIVTSCNEDFNISRLERYLAVAYDADVEPVIILTKIDLTEDVNKFVDQVRALDDLLMIEPVNALEPKTLESLKAWCKAGQTIALMGSSGVGKSTIANGLGSDIQKTGIIREDDAKGKHTTTHRSLLPLKDGAILLDTPGMRELQITDCEVGVATVFADIEALSANCRFNDCRHDNEPGCAVRVAIDKGNLEPRRLASYRKLMAEQARNAATLAEKRHKDKELSKFYSRTLKQSHKLKGRT